jgi:hypothetical protein
MQYEPQVEQVRAWRRLYRRAARWLLHHQGSPHSIALGFAVGMFVALTPTVGIQMVISGLVAHWLRANRPIPIALAWITNPLTVVPVYYFNYRVGLLLLPGDEEAGRRLVEMVSSASLSDPAGLVAAAQTMATELWGVAGVLWAGSLVVATVAAALCYPVVRWLVEFERTKLETASTLPSLPPPAEPVDRATLPLGSRA